MATPTNYYFNRNRVQVSIMGDDLNVYYLVPRANVYIPVGLKANYVLPAGVIEVAIPGWWDPGMWPGIKPWDPQPTPSIQQGSASTSSGSQTTHSGKTTQTSKKK